MPDDFDRAQQINEQHQLDALGAHFRNRTHGPGSELCLDCGEPIPMKRRRAVPHCSRCIDCQRDRERGT